MRWGWCLFLACLCTHCADTGIQLYRTTCTGNVRQRAEGYGIEGQCTFTRTTGVQGEVSLCTRIVVQNDANNPLLDSNREVRGMLVAGQSQVMIDYWVPVPMLSISAPSPMWYREMCR